MGRLCAGLGEAQIPQLMPWLLDALCRADAQAVERAGAAQGLAEVMAALGSDSTRAMLIDDLLPLHQHPSKGVREGVHWLLSFLPTSFGPGHMDEFSEFIAVLLPIIVAGLSDEHETVRDVALRAGQVSQSVT